MLHGINGKAWALCLGAMAVTVLLFWWSRTHPRAVETGSWGLSFQEEGQAPVGNTSPAELARYGGAFVGSPDRKVLYLTFDAGYENGNTEAILDTLKAHGAPGTFFVVGHYLEQAPELVKRMVEEGHTVGNHTWTHPDMSRIEERESFTRELRQVEDRFREITGRDLAPYYRPPRGCYSEKNLALAQELGYHTVFWSLAYVDWIQEDQPTREEAFAKLLPRVHPGAVVLLHVTSKTNGEILDELLTRWEEQGYTFAPIEALFSPVTK